MKKTSSLKNNLFITTAMAAGLVSGYARTADAGCSFVGAPATYHCSGVSAMPYIFNSPNTTIIADGTFSLFGSMQITGPGTSTFIDDPTSYFFGSSNSSTILVRSALDYAGVPGSVNFTLNGEVTSPYIKGVELFNYASGSITATINGTINDTYGAALTVLNNAAGKDVIVITGDNSVISALRDDTIFVRNYGTGNTTLDLGGQVKNNQPNGITIEAHGQDLNITTRAGSEIVSTYGMGIFAFNRGTGQTDITLNGEITARYSAGDFISGANTTSATFTQGATGKITSSHGDGIFFQHDGSGTADITINGEMTAQNNTGTFFNGGNSTDMNFTLGATGKIVSSQGTGINLLHSGSGVMDITVNGNVTAQSPYAAVYAHNISGTDLSITTGANSKIVSHSGRGIQAINAGTGNTHIDISGDVFSADIMGFYVPGQDAAAVYIRNEASAQDMFITVRSGAELENVIDADSDSGALRAINYGSGNVSVIIEDNATLRGSRHGAIISNHANSTLSITVGKGAVLETNTQTYGISGLLARATDGDIEITIKGHVGSIDSSIGGLISQQSGSGQARIDIHAGSTIQGDAAGIIAYSSQPTVINTAGDIFVGAGALYGGAPLGAIALSFSAPAVSELNIFGGRIVGDVVDMHVTNGGLSTVNIKNNFTSEGDFNVSHFNVDNGTTFTAGKGTTVKTTLSAVDVLGTFRVTDTAAVIGGLANRGTVNLESGSHLTIDTMAAGATGTLLFGVDSSTSHGLLTITSGPANMTGQTVKVDVSNTANLADGTELLIIDGTGAVVGAPAAGGIAVSSTSPLYDFNLFRGSEISGGDDSQLYLTVGKAAPQAQVQVDGAIVAATLTFADTAVNLTGERLSSLRTPFASGVAAGDNANTRIWAQALGQKLDQGMRKGIAGYDAKLFGATLGVDTDHYTKDGVIGLAFSYGNSRIDSKDIFNSKTNINSYQLTVYGDYNWASGTYVEGQLAYAFNRNDKTRYNAGGAGLNAKSTFNSHNFAARGEAGRTFTSGAAFVTPFALASWLRYTADDYTETGAGLGNLSVNSKTLNQIDLGLGAKAGMNIKTDSGVVVPEIHALYSRDMLGDSLSTTQSYVAGGGPVMTVDSPDPARNKLSLGARVKYYNEGGFELTGVYDFSVKQDYTAHTGLLRAGWTF